MAALSKPQGPQSTWRYSRRRARSSPRHRRAFVALRDPAILSQRASAQLPRMLGPPIVLFALWRWYVMQNLPRSEQAFRPIYEWNFGALRQTLFSIGDLIADAPLFHSMMWLVTAAGLAIVFRWPGKSSEALWLAVICATVWLGYNVFLLIVYIGVMSDSDAQIAADYGAIRHTRHCLGFTRRSWRSRSHAGQRDCSDKSARHCSHLGGNPASTLRHANSP